MELNIKSTNLVLTEAIKNYSIKKISKLDKILSKEKLINADFEIQKTTNHHNKGEIFRAELNLELPGKLLRVEKTEKDLYKAIDKVQEHMDLQLKKYKEKKQEKKRKV